MAKPRILFFDLETAGVNALKADLGFILMVGYKWAHEKDAHVLTIKKKHLKHFDDGPLCEKFSKMYTKADLVVAHFGSVFDRRMFQGRLLINRLPPIPPTIMRDTCMITRSVANFSSNRLKNLGDTLQLKNRKIDKGDGWPRWWFKAMQGDMKELQAMADYCKGDVLALEELYYRLRPFDNSHPRLHSKLMMCGSCGAHTIRQGYRYTKERKYIRYQCTACRKWGQKGLKAA